MISEYWENCYTDGGNSGTTELGKEWLWLQLMKYTSMDDVIDVGCGDLYFWEGKDCDKYTGIDISSTIIKENRLKRPKWDFICDSADKPQQISSSTVISFNFLFHIMDEEVFLKIIHNMITYSKDSIIIWTWGTNPLNEKKNRFKIKLWLLRKGKIGELLAIRGKEITTDYVYQQYRDFEDYIPIFEKRGFKLISCDVTDKYPYGSLYIFKKL